MSALPEGKRMLVLNNGVYGERISPDGRSGSPGRV